MATILETKSVTKKFGGFTAVDNVSLKVDSGEIRFVIGQWSGKKYIIQINNWFSFSKFWQYFI